MPKERAKACKKVRKSEQKTCKKAGKSEPEQARSKTKRAKCATSNVVNWIKRIDLLGRFPIKSVGVPKLYVKANTVISAD